ncbi:unnamed protein product, partial [Didymodactylos carnosus]
QWLNKLSTEYENLKFGTNHSCFRSEETSQDDDDDNCEKHGEEETEHDEQKHNNTLLTMSCHLSWVHQILLPTQASDGQGEEQTQQQQQQQFTTTEQKQLPSLDFGSNTVRPVDLVETNLTDKSVDRKDTLIVQVVTELATQLLDVASEYEQTENMTLSAIISDYSAYLLTSINEPLLQKINSMDE